MRSDFAFSKFEYEYNDANNPFMNIPKPKNKREHYEVTDYSISLIKKCYTLFDKYDYKKSSSHRGQMTTPGAYLTRNKGLEHKHSEDIYIDIVADILTSEKYVIKNWQGDLVDKYHKVHHTIGNIIPMPEGANAGMPGEDCYYDKLTLIKKYITLLKQKEQIIDKDEINSVENRIKQGISLGSLKGESFEKYPPIKKAQTLRYWINKNNITEWEQFVSDYFLQDFCNEKKDIKEMNDLEVIIKLIISRGYRILNKGNEPEPGIVDEIFKTL